LLSNASPANDRHVRRLQPPACPQNFIGWADAGTIEYPNEAGFPFGLGETRSILLEVHYENLARTKGIVDTSGLEFTCVAELLVGSVARTDAADSALRLRYTAQLRPHDLGYIIVGDALERQVAEVRANGSINLRPSSKLLLQVQREPQVLPAGYAEYEVANMCPGECTRRMSDEDMHVVSTTFHMVRRFALARSLAASCAG
jgi:hypothetical protein